MPSSITHFVPQPSRPPALRRKKGASNQSWGEFRRLFRNVRSINPLLFPARFAELFQLLAYLPVKLFQGERLPEPLNRTTREFIVQLEFEELPLKKHPVEIGRAHGRTPVT